MKSTHRIASFMLAIFLMLIAMAPAVSATERSLKNGIAFVTATSLRLRSGPSGSSTTLDYAPGKDVVVVLGRSGSWYKVSYNLQVDYMHKDYLSYSTKENSELGYGMINGNNVKVRSGPGTNYTILTAGYKGDKAYIIGINSQWFKVIFGDYVGYIRSDYVDLTEIPYENKDSTKTPLFYIGGTSTGLKPSAEALQNNTGTSLTSRIINTAKKHIGVPYLWGGTTTKGFDCSGFTQYVYRQHGITIPRVSRDQYNFGTKISRANLQPGDLVFFNTSGEGVSHVGIYIGSGQFIHASTSKGVTIANFNSSYWVNCYMGARRVV